MSSVFKVTAGTYNSVFVILQTAELAASKFDITEVLVQFNWVYNFVLIKGISNDLKKDEIYFSGTMVCAFFQIGLSPTKAVALLGFILVGFPNKCNLCLYEDASSVKSALFGHGSCLLN